MPVDGGFAPKLPSSFTGNERFRDSSAQSKFQTVLGLGTMATQNANNVNISGGNATGLSNVSTSQISSGYYYGNYSYVSYLYPYQVTSTNDSTQYLTAGYATIGGTTWGEQTITTTGAQIADNVTVVFVDATNGGACGGTPSASCYDHGDSTSCGDNNAHGGCSWGSVTCSSYNGDETNCNYYHCTWESADCAGIGNQMTCTNTSGCTWGGGSMGECDSFDADQTTCQSTSGCSWDGGSAGNDCHVLDADQTNCELTTGCTWNAEVDGDCHQWDGTDQTTCESTSGCTWDGGGSVCNGSYLITPANCSGFYNPIPSSCSGSYVITPDSCSGSYATGNCVSSGNEGYCYGTPTCQHDQTYCNAESGCSWTTGLNITMPSGVDGKSLRVIKTDTTANAVNIYPYPSSGWTLRGQSYITLSTPYHDAWLSAQTSTTQWF